jgi:hypothetical protein
MKLLRRNLCCFKLEEYKLLLCKTTELQPIIFFFVFHQNPARDYIFIEKQYILNPIFHAVRACPALDAGYEILLNVNIYISSTVISNPYGINMDLGSSFIL